MIIVSVGGGLGNQMFQTAFAIKISKIYKNHTVYVDYKYPYMYSHNGYEISKLFDISFQQANFFDVLKLTEWKYINNVPFFLKLFSRIKSKIFFSNKYHIIQENNTIFDPKFFNLDKNLSYYLHGVFGSYKFFDDIKDDIINAFQFKYINNNSLSLLSYINNSFSVSIHIRRGDYIKWGHNLLNKQFYVSAIKLLAKRLNIDISKLNFFVFSDDINFARDMFHDFKNFSFINFNKKEYNYCDMFLMSKCKYNIIANSSFSFWGAYLNNYTNKIVISPKVPTIKNNNAFTCDDWIKI